jgi:2-hydroxychromene-2-carboxylate isomerase
VRASVERMDQWATNGSPGAVFYFDVGSPYAWLAAERVEAVLPLAIVWRPILLGALFKRHGRGSWARTLSRAEGIATIEKRAAERGLPPVRWPYPFPNDGLPAMRVAAFADLAGRTREFALAALRVHFVEGHPLSEWYAIARAIAAAELPKEAINAPRDPSVKAHLRHLTDEALEAGVIGVPTICLDGELFWGDDRLEDAASRASAISTAPAARTTAEVIAHARPSDSGV